MEHHHMYKLNCTDTGTQTGTTTRMKYDAKFKYGFGCWDVLVYLNGDVSGTGNVKC